MTRTASITATPPAWTKDSPGGVAAWKRYQTDLERAVPSHRDYQDAAGKGISWLYLRWHEGDPWAPVGRWIVWQVWPKGMYPFGYEEGIGAELAGPHPRSEGHYCGGLGWCPETDDGRPICLPPKFKWVGGPCQLITKAQWEIARETGGCYATRYWVIQGAGAGHRVDLSPAEVAIAGAHGLPIEMPAMGSLPYLEPHDGVWAMLAQYDLLHRWQRETSRSFTERTTDDMEREQAEKARAAAELAIRLMDHQVEGFYSENKGLIKRAAQETRGTLGDAKNVRLMDGDAVSQLFINESIGRLY